MIMVTGDTLQAYAKGDQCLCGIINKTSCAGGRHNMPSPPASWPWPFDLDLLTLKVVSESVPTLFFLGLSVLDLGPMYATDRRQTRIIA